AKGPVPMITIRSAQCGVRNAEWPEGVAATLACSLSAIIGHSEFRHQLGPQTLQLLESPLNFFVAGHLAVVALALELDFELAHFVADFQLGSQPEAIDEELAIEMVSLVLDDARQQSFGLDAHGLAGQVIRVDRHALGSLYVSV